DRLARANHLLLLGEQCRGRTVEQHCVDAEVDEYGLAAIGDDECVRFELEQTSADRREDDLRSRVGQDRHTRPDQGLGEDRVRHLLQGDDLAFDWRDNEHGCHIKSSMSPASVSASGPTMTWTIFPASSTPCAPAARSAASLTRLALTTSLRKRVMHGSISTMLFTPP